MNVTVDLMNATAEKTLPSQSDFEMWSLAAMQALSKEEQNNNNFELSIRLIDEDESASLNQNYRQKEGSTNILSFPFGDMQMEDIHFLGDLAICAPVVKRESQEQNKALMDHWAHMTVHGVLHLNAYDHENESEAQTMESLEIDILKTLGFNNPYDYTQDN